MTLFLLGGLFPGGVSGLPRQCKFAGDQIDYACMLVRQLRPEKVGLFRRFAFTAMTFFVPKTSLCSANMTERVAAYGHRDKPSARDSVAKVSNSYKKFWKASNRIAMLRKFVVEVERLRGEMAKQKGWCQKSQSWKDQVEEVAK